MGVMIYLRIIEEFNFEKGGVNIFSLFMKVLFMCVCGFIFSIKGGN